MFCVLFLCLTHFLSAQQTVTGKVLFESQVITDANVLIRPLGLGAVTDSNGKFEFKNVPLGKYKLVISSVGYRKRVVPFNVTKNNGPVLNINLSREDQKISQVDIVARAYDHDIISEPMSEPISMGPTTTTIERINMEKQGAVTLVDAMKYVPGAFTETRGRKVKQFFSVRGQKYPYPAYCINGIWQREFHETPYFFNSSNIEEIKIVRSSSALLKSLSPLSGVIDITTRKYDKKETDFQMEYGSLNSYRAGINHGNKVGKIQYSGGVNVFGSDGPSNRNGKEQIWNVNGAMDWQLSDKLDLSVYLFYMGGSRQLVQPIAPADPKFANRKEEYKPLSTFMASSVLKYHPSKCFTSELQINYANRKPQYRFENVKSGDITEYDEKDWEFTVNHINALAIGADNVLRFGVLYNHWMAPKGKRFYYGKKADVHTFSAVIADQHRVGKLTMDAGFRITREYLKDWGGFSIEGSSGKFRKVNAIEDEWQSALWQASGGLSYALAGKSSIHINTSGGIVTPRKGALNTEGEQPDNESRWNVDLGYVKTFEQSGSLSVSAFLANRKNALDYSGETIEMDNGDIRELYTNRDKRNYGIEISGKTPLVKNLFSVFTNITLMKGEIQKDGQWDEDDEMPNIIANAGCTLEMGQWDYNFFAHYTGAYKNDRFLSKDYLKKNGKMDLGDFVTLDMTLGYRLGTKYPTRIFAQVKNLLDKKYQTVVGFPSWGRIITVGAKVTL